MGALNHWDRRCTYVSGGKRALLAAEVRGGDLESAPNLGEQGQDIQDALVKWQTLLLLCQESLESKLQRTGLCFGRSELRSASFFLEISSISLFCRAICTFFLNIAFEVVNRRIFKFHAGFSEVVRRSHRKQPFTVLTPQKRSCQDEGLLATATWLRFR